MCVEFVSPGKHIKYFMEGDKYWWECHPLPTWSTLQLEAHYPSLNSHALYKLSHKSSNKKPCDEIWSQKWWTEYLSLGFIMKLHSFANLCIFIGHFPLNIIKNKRKPSSFTLLGFIHFIWFDISCFCALAIRTQHCSILASSFAFHSERCVQKKVPPGINTCTGTAGSPPQQQVAHCCLMNTAICYYRSGAFHQTIRRLSMSLFQANKKSLFSNFIFSFLFTHPHSPH